MLMKKVCVCLIFVFFCYRAIGAENIIDSTWEKNLSDIQKNAPISAWYSKFGKLGNKQESASSITEVRNILKLLYTDKEAETKLDQTIASIGFDNLTQANWNYVFVLKAINKIKEHNNYLNSMNLLIEELAQNYKQNNMICQRNLRNLEQSIFDAKIYIMQLPVAKTITDITQKLDQMKSINKIAQKNDKSKCESKDPEYNEAIKTINNYKDKTGLFGFEYVALNKPQLEDAFKFFSWPMRDLENNTPANFIKSYLFKLQSFNGNYIVAGRQNEIINVDDDFKIGLKQILNKKVNFIKYKNDIYTFTDVDFNNFEDPDKFLIFLLNSYLICGIETLNFENSKITSNALEQLFKKIEGKHVLKNINLKNCPITLGLANKIITYLTYCKRCDFFTLNNGYKMEFSKQNLPMEVFNILKNHEYDLNIIIHDAAIDQPTNILSSEQKETIEKIGKLDQEKTKLEHTITQPQETQVTVLHQFSFSHKDVVTTIEQMAQGGEFATAAQRCTAATTQEELNKQLKILVTEIVKNPNIKYGTKKRNVPSLLKYMNMTTQNYYNTQMPKLTMKLERNDNSAWRETIETIQNKKILTIHQYTKAYEEASEYTDKNSNIMNILNAMFYEIYIRYDNGNNELQTIKASFQKK